MKKEHIYFDSRGDWHWIIKRGNKLQKRLKKFYKKVVLCPTGTLDFAIKSALKMSPKLRRNIKPILLSKEDAKKAGVK